MGSAFLLFAGGLNGLILPIRGEIEGFTAASLGLLGTGWALGYVMGCLFTPWLVKRVGHIRAFGAMCAIAAITVLASLLFLTPWVWIPLRGLCGFCFAGAAMVVESWLNDKADNKSRGRIFGIYTMVNLGATTAGQLVITLGDPSGYLFFVLAAMIYCTALLPTAMSATTTPTALVSVKLDLKRLWRNSPIAVFSVLMVGVSNAAFGSLSAVYAARIGLTLSDVALFASVPVLAGALAQVPVGALSDRLDRRVVLVGVALLGLCADLIFIFAGLEGVTLTLAVAAVFGASVYAMYPLIVAHANDHAAPGTSLQVSGGLLLVFGVGSIVGPTIAGFAMTGLGTSALFWVTGSAHVLLILFALLRIRTRAPVPQEDKTAFKAAPSTRAMTPETAVLAGEDEVPAATKE
ncbi:Predicted arabinose efflux permease, MFS family [Roseivivax lentus]|uniref:Predicted arabinose efflux permease, MFS family n=2 Tax=Roseivivax lentus TaxID=633194 RepID=A0A1N7NF18_9RHOB|nr:Predicted arabinose efflux permease, MFS family [Roseivivax lentus]